MVGAESETLHVPGEEQRVSATASQPCQSQGAFRRLQSSRGQVDAMI